MTKLYFYLIALLLLILASCADNKKEKAILNCTDYDYVKFANNNPHLFINFDFSNIINAAERREILLKKETSDEKAKRLEKMKEAKIKDTNKYFVGREYYYDTINLELIKSLNALERKEYNNIINKKLYELKKDFKLNEFYNYKKFYENCRNELNKKSDDAKKKMNVFEWYIYGDQKDYDISKLLKLNKERNDKVINLLKKYSEMEIFIKKFQTTNSYLL